MGLSILYASRSRHARTPGRPVDSARLSGRIAAPGAAPQPRDSRFPDVRKDRLRERGWSSPHRRGASQADRQINFRAFVGAGFEPGDEK